MQRDPLCLRLTSEVCRHPVEQGIDPKGFELRSDGPGLDLVDVEQRVQHPGHAAQGLIEPTDQFFCLLADHNLREKLLEQHKRLQWLSKVVTCGREKAGFGHIGGICLQPCVLQRRCRFLLMGNIGKRYDDTFDLLTIWAIRQYAADVPGAA